MSLDSDEHGRTEARQWAWVFRGLWSCAPRAGHDETTVCGGSSSISATRRGAPRIVCRLQLRVPDTILFDRGVPRKWIATSPGGVVVRKTFLSPNVCSDTIAYSESSSTRRGMRLRLRSLPEKIARASRGGNRQSSSSLSSGGMDELEVLERLDAVRAACVEFAKPSSPEMPVCIAWYNDGSKELLSATSLQRLCGYHNWRVSVCGIQAYVCCAQREVGTYSRSASTESRKRSRRSQITEDSHQNTHDDGRPSRGHQETSFKHSSRRRSSKRVPGRSASSPSVEDASDSPRLHRAAAIAQPTSTALDVATTNVAFVADMSYSWSKSRFPHGIDTAILDENAMGDRNNSNTVNPTAQQAQRVVTVGGMGEGSPWPTSRIRVAHLEAEFIIDHTGCTWFSHATRTLVESVPRPPKQELDHVRQAAKRKHMLEEASLAASVAARELRALVILACRRGLNADEAFRHFDAAQRGHVGQDEMRYGMASLGVHISDEAASLLINMVATCSQEHCGTSDSRVRTKLSPRARQSYERVGGDSEASDTGARHSAREQDARPAAERLREHITAADLWCFARTPDNLSVKDKPNEVHGTHPSLDEVAEHNRTCTIKHLLHSRFDHHQTKSISEKRRRRNESDERCQSFPGKLPASDLPTDFLAGTRRRQANTESAKASGSNGDRWADSGDAHRIAATSTRSSSTKLCIGGECSSAPSRVDAELARKQRVDSVPSRVSRAHQRRKRAQESDVDASYPTLHHRVTTATTDSTRRGVESSGDKPVFTCFPCSDPVAEAISAKDRVFHVDRYLI